MKGVFKCATEGDERRSWSVKRSSLGMPPCTPKIFKETQASKLGDAPVHPLLHQQLSVRPSLHYILITSCVMCYAWSVSLFTFPRLFLLCLLVIKMSEPNMLDWERYTLHFKLEHLIEFSCLFFAVSCSLYFLSCCPV